VRGPVDDEMARAPFRKPLAASVSSRGMASCCCRWIQRNPFTSDVLDAVVMETSSWRRRFFLPSPAYGRTTMTVPWSEPSSPVRQSTSGRQVDRPKAFVTDGAAQPHFAEGRFGSLVPFTFCYAGSFATCAPPTGLLVLSKEKADGGPSWVRCEQTNAARTSP
jgi:hypothetical protein